MISRSRDAQIGLGVGGRGNEVNMSSFVQEMSPPPGIEAEVLLALRRGLT